MQSPNRIVSLALLGVSVQRHRRGLPPSIYSVRSMAKEWTRLLIPIHFSFSRTKKTKLH
jgi:hypothetical protein